MAGIFCNLLYLAVITMLTIVIADDYCNMKSCDEKGSHTMCQYPSTDPAAECEHVYKTGLSESEKQQIVKKHNDLRQRVAAGLETRGNPGPQYAANNMKTLIWDNKLADIAHRWAIQCNFAHDKCRNVDKYWVGQNIVLAYSWKEDTYDLNSMIQLWYDEVDKFNRSKVQNYKFEKGIGHYTQVIWAETDTVGCGLSIYKNSKSNDWISNMLVCNYGPSGNWQGRNVYEIRN